MNVLLHDTLLGELEILEVYLQYNGPRLFSCFNSARQIYLALWVDEENEVDIWLLVPISYERLSHVTAGNISIRQAFEESETRQLYYIEVTASQIVSRFDLVRINEVSEDLLPLPDAKLKLFGRPKSVGFPASDSRKTNREILDVSLKYRKRNLYEASARKLGYFLSELQGLIDSIGQVVTGSPTAVGKVPEAITSQTELNVVATYTGSFRIRLAAPGPRDGEFLGSLLAPEAIAKLLDLLEATKTENTLLELLPKLGARTVSTYKKVLKALINTDAGLLVEWDSLEPQLDRSAELTYEEIGFALAAIGKLDVREVETIKIIGTLVEGNAESGHFQFKDGEERKITGYAQNTSILNNAVLKNIYGGTFRRVVLVGPSGDLETEYTLIELQLISKNEQRDVRTETENH